MKDWMIEGSRGGENERAGIQNCSFYGIIGGKKTGL